MFEFVDEIGFRWLSVESPNQIKYQIVDLHLGLLAQDNF